jgi:uncharacterized membrane protein
VNFENLKLFYVLSCIALILIILLPTMAAVVPVAEGEQFSELWLLGPGHTTEDFPSNVVEGGSYRIYLGVGNHMGDLEYYRVYVKLKNQSEPSPDSATGLPSSLEPVFEYNIFLRNNDIWERELSFSFEGVSFEGNVSRVSKILLGGYALDVDKIAVWNETSNGFYYELFFELWAYNAVSDSLQFNNRSVWIWLNVTENSYV